MLNRAALILRYKQPFVDWINAVDPSPTSHALTLAEINEGEHTVYLIEVEDENELDKWLALNHQEHFEEERESNEYIRHRIDRGIRHRLVVERARRNLRFRRHR